MLDLYSEIQVQNEEPATVYLDYLNQVLAPILKSNSRNSKITPTEQLLQEEDYQIRENWTQFEETHGWIEILAGGWKKLQVSL